MNSWLDDEDLQEQMAEMRAVALSGDAKIFAPLLQQLDAAQSEQEAVVAMLAITIADLDELIKQASALEDAKK